jgi:hypothetical protein
MMSDLPSESRVANYLYGFWRNSKIEFQNATHLDKNRGTAVLPRTRRENETGFRSMMSDLPSENLASVEGGHQKFKNLFVALLNKLIFGFNFYNVFAWKQFK